MTTQVKIINLGSNVIIVSSPDGQSTALLPATANAPEITVNVWKDTKIIITEFNG